MKKQLVKQLNSQKGFTGADVMIALLIIVTTLGVITMIYVNLVVDSKSVDKKTGATRIATNLMENLEMCFYDDLETNLQDLCKDGTMTKNGTTYSVNGGKNVKIFNTTIPEDYQVSIDLVNSYGTQTDSQYDLVKKATVKVEYLADGKTKDVTLDKVLTKEVIRECNSPNFEAKYVQTMVGKDTYQMYSDYIAGQEANKIICPIQYDATAEAYKLVEDVSSIWYSYSNKQWARTLVLDSAEVNNVINQETKIVDMSQIEDTWKEKCYVWIPRFGIKNGYNSFGGTLFCYKDTDYGIVKAEDETTGLLITQLDRSVVWMTEGISAFIDDNENQLLGMWQKESQTTETGSVAYYLNSSQYGPLFQY